MDTMDTTDRSSPSGFDRSMVSILSIVSTRPVRHFLSR